MLDLIEILKEEPIECTECDEEAILRIFILRDSRPYELMTVRDCRACGSIDTTQEDYEVLPYSVKITCDFTNNEKSSENFGRMAFLNNNTKVSVFVDSELLFDFTCAICYVDCIQGILMRGQEIFSHAKSIEGNEDLIESIDTKLNSIIDGSGYKLIIEDPSGFSRICPFGVEYAEFQNNELETFQEENIKYEKIDKNED